MRTPTRVATFCLMALLVLAIATQKAVAQDPVKMAPSMHKLLLDNDRVRVYEVTIKAGTTLGMHSHPAFVSYYLSAAKGKFTMADGSTRDADVKVGDVRWNDSVTHSFENTGTTDAHALVMELKPAKKKK